MDIQYLHLNILHPIVGISKDLSFYQRRRQVTQFLYLMLHKTVRRQLPILSSKCTRIRRLLNSLSDPNTWKLVFLAGNNKGNECNIPSYHFLHGMLEWKLLDLCILYKYNTNINENDVLEEKLQMLVKQIEKVLDDLLICSLFVFNKKRPAEILYTTPFSCTCFKEFWLLLQLMFEKWFVNINVSIDNKLYFWTLFNKRILNLKTHMSSYSLTPTSFYQFVNWMIHTLTFLYGYRSNGDFEGCTYVRAKSEGAENQECLENCVQEFFHSNPNEEQTRTFLCLLTPIVVQWWRPKVNIPMILWEHFYKRFNSSFYTTRVASSTLALVCNTGNSYLQKYRSMLENQKIDANMSSYSLFTLILGKILKRLIKQPSNNQVQKILGRIYSKFSVQKFLALNDTGIHHLIQLVLILALCCEFNAIATKLRDIFLSISFDKITINKQLIVARGHMALLTLYAEHKSDLSEYIMKLLQQLSYIHNNVSVSKIFSDALMDILKLADDYRRGEHLLINAWIPIFLKHCTPVEQERPLKAIHLIFSNIRTNGYFFDADIDILRSLNTYILPFLKQHYSTGFSPLLPQLAADFCNHYNITSDVLSFQKLFRYFIDIQTANKQALPIFLSKVLDYDKNNLVDFVTIFQVWLRSLVLLNAQNEEVASLTKIIVTMPVFKSMTNLNADEIFKSKEPLCVFIAAVGKKYESCMDFKERCEIADNFNSFLCNFEKWIPTDIKQERSEVLFRFYSFLAIVIYNCSHIVYVKSKITCFFHIAITRFILTTNVQMGKVPEGKVPQFVHKIWPVIVQGIGRLSFKSDPYINNTLNDLIQKWTPIFKISNNPKVVARPFITCLQSENYELSLFVFEKLTNIFLATQRRQADINACLVITIYKEVVEACSGNHPINEKRLETLMKGSCLLTLEHIMMVDEIVPSRILLLEYFKQLTGCTIFINSHSLKDLMTEYFRLIAKKHLAYYSFFYFELLMKFVPICVDVVDKVMNFLIVEVEIVEAKRGAGKDVRLRSCLNKLQRSLAVFKQKVNSN
ncbi:protein MMS22-like isoform X2 [Teleopsis dalmanni]|nr:protein MMS22-like isoform X2 [Teleopsis dalmanni]